MVFRRRRQKQHEEGAEGSSSEKQQQQQLPLHKGDNSNTDIYPEKKNILQQQPSGSEAIHDPTKVNIDKLDDDNNKNNNDHDKNSADGKTDSNGGSGSDKTPSESSDDTTTVAEADIDDDETNMMLEVILKIRADPAFAKSMYATCPRLQHLLNRNPDLRPIFEDPHLICLNFEKVYKDSGGILPEDEVKPTQYQLFKKAVLARIKIITQHPMFKVFKCLLLLKKLAGFVSPMKLISFVKGCFKSMFCDLCEDPDVDLDDLSVPDVDEDTMQARIALNNAADYMEDPDVQDEMNQMMENPETMENSIENNDALRSLRDSNPVCSELMSDPETMKILTNPDNLRALGEAPDCISADFAGGMFEPPDVDVDFGGDGLDVIDEVDFDAEMDIEGGADDLLEDDDIDFDDDIDDNDDAGGDDDQPETEQETDDVDDDDDGGEDDEDEEGEDDEEGEEEEEEGPAAEDFEYENEQGGGNKGGAKTRSRGKPQKKSKAKAKGGKGRLAGAMTEAAVAFGAGYILGDAAELLTGGGGDDIDVDGLDELDGDADLPDADGADDLLDDADDADLPEDDMPDEADIDDVDAADVAATAALAAWAASGDGMDTLAGEAEDIADTAEGAAEEEEEKKKVKKVIVHPDGRRTIAYVEEGEEDDDDEEDNGRFGFLKDGLATFVDTAKETALAQFIGDDLAEEALERLGEEDDDEEDDDEDDLPSDDDESDLDSQDDGDDDRLSDDNDYHRPSYADADNRPSCDDNDNRHSDEDDGDVDDRSRRRKNDGAAPTAEDDFANALGFR